MKKIYILLSLIFLLGARPALAQYAQPTTPYSAPQVPLSQLLINKWVLNPQTNQFVDNLSVDQFQFLPNQEVSFRIEVKNTGTNSLTNIKVIDTLPAQVSFSSGALTYDSSTNTYFYLIDKLDPGQVKDTDFKVKIKGVDSFASSVFCMTNLAQAQTGNMVSQDTASFCATKNIMGSSKNLPQTGPDTLSILLSSISLLIISLLIKPNLLKGGE